jgi:hypothetical protein
LERAFLTNALPTNALSNAMLTELRRTSTKMDCRLPIALGGALAEVHYQSFIEPHKPYKQGT